MQRKTLSFWQLASVVIQEGEESYTTNLCQKCYNDSLKAKGRKNTEKLAVALENDGKRTIRTRNVGILLPREKG